MLTGTVKAWIADRGFGFITPDTGGEDIFCHFRSIVGDVDRLEIGQRVEFYTEANPRDGRPRAVDVRVIG